jgi:hypothetical protein
MAGTAAAEAYEWRQGFEENTDGWSNFGVGTVHREQSGYTNADGYADGVDSSEGDWHARLRNGGCTVSCIGPFTGWGKDTASNSDFPEGGYRTAVDIYLDTGWAAANPDRRFDFSSGINNADGTHLRDFAFNAGTSPVADDGAFVVSASPNAGRADSYPSNPGRNPVSIEESGWYTFEHVFSDDGGVLSVEMAVRDAEGDVVGSWQLGGDDMANVGGDRYGWFANQEIDDLAIDDSQIQRGEAPVANTPATKQDCMQGGWQDLEDDEFRPFRNQGDCVSWVATGGKKGAKG